MEAGVTGKELLRVAESPKKSEANGCGEHHPDHPQVVEHVEEDDETGPEDGENNAYVFFGDAVRVECWFAEPKINR